MENIGKGLTVTKISADSSAENTPNTPEFICPICMPKPKSSGFKWNKSKSKYISRLRVIKILARFYKKYVAKQEYFANTALN